MISSVAIVCGLVVTPLAPPAAARTPHARMMFGGGGGEGEGGGFMCAPNPHPK
jgi:hypothetical protein